jgi:uncharacterized protein
VAPLRHAPERTCVACRQAQPKRQLIRVVRTLADGVQVDPTGKLAGRGAYLCRQATCWELGLRKGILARALKTAVTATDRAMLEAFAADLSPQRG